MEASDPADVELPRRAEQITAPRYGTASLADVLPSVLHHLTDGRAGAARTPLPAVGRGVVLLVVDGLGSRQLARHPDAAPLLSSLTGDVDAVFPSTTVASIASIGTGLPPAQHGLVGYAFPVPGHDHPLAGLRWHIGKRGGGFDARSIVVPEQLQPEPTCFEQAAAAGVGTTVVLAPGFVDSGLTRAALRGGDRITARGLEASLDVACTRVAQAQGQALAYVHHPDVDHAGHEDGADSPRWRAAVAEVDRVLRAVQRRLPPHVTVLVTSDHGMLTIPPREVIDLADHPELRDGVRVLAGEPRVRTLSLHDGEDPGEVAARWRATLGERAVVATRSEALRLYGPRPTATALAHMGELVVLPRFGTIVDASVDPRGARHVGQHGGPTRAERLVPLRAVNAT